MIGARPVGLVVLAAALLGQPAHGDPSAAGRPVGRHVRVSQELEIYYQEAGTGRPLVLIPGWTFSSEVFERQLAHFSARFRVMALDPRSQGRSSRTSESNTYTQHGADLAAFLDRLALKDVVLVGWSWGCHGLYAYVRAHGTDGLRAAVCIDQTPRSLGPESEWAEGDVEDFQRSLKGLLYARRERAERLARWMVKRPLGEDELRWLVDQSLATPTGAALSLYVDGTLADYTPEAERLDGKLPVLNFVDRESAPQARAWLQRHAPHSELQVVDGHMGFWADADGFNRALEDFLARLP